MLLGNALELRLGIRGGYGTKEGQTDGERERGETRGKQRRKEDVEVVCTIAILFFHYAKNIHGNFLQAGGDDKYMVLYSILMWHDSL